MSKYLIVNSSPIITLSKAKLLFLLLDNKEYLIIPNDVYNEVLKKDTDEVFVHKDELLKRVNANYVIPNEILSWGLGKGESSVIATGLTFSNSVVVIDDLQARKCAQINKLNVIGTLGIVIAAKKEGKIKSAKEAIIQLIFSGLYLDQNLIQKVLHEKVNESWDFI